MRNNGSPKLGTQQAVAFRESIQIEVPATHKYLNVVAACIREVLERVDNLHDREKLGYNVALAVHEVCINIVDHAYAGAGEGRIQVILELRSDPIQFVVELSDAGRPFDPAAVPEPDLDQPKIHGYGLLVVRQLMDEVTYRSKGGRNCWRLVKRLPLRAQA